MGFMADAGPTLPILENRVNSHSFGPCICTGLMIYTIDIYFLETTRCQEPQSYSGPDDPRR